MNAFDFSVVIPVYNEEKNIRELYRRLTNTMEGLARPYEVIFVNDGSRDGTLNHLKAIQAQDPHVKVLDLARNFGHQAAVTAGIDHAVGKAVIVMDGDLQDPPEVILEFVERWQQGYDVVYAVRGKRKESILKRLAYASFYRFLRAMSDTDLPLDAGDFSLMDRKVVAVLRQMPERNRFVRGLRSWVGFNQVGVEYERAKRYEGEPKYTLKALVGLATNGFVSFSKLPLRLATYLGVLVSVLAFLAGLAVVILRLVAEVKPQGWTSLMVVVLFLGGVQLITVGIVGEYIGHVLDEVRQRPAYIVREWSRGGDDREVSSSWEGVTAQASHSRSSHQPAIHA
jgi:dolichol-phosphate mannosyltransferase